MDCTIFSFSHNVFKSCLLLMRQNKYGVKGEMKLKTWFLSDKGKKTLWEKEKMQCFKKASFTESGLCGKGLIGKKTLGK